MLSPLPWIPMSNWSSVWKPFPCGLPPPLAFVLFPLPLPQWSLSLGRQVFNAGLQFRDKHSIVSCSLHVGQLWFSVLVSICCMMKLLLWDLRDALICEYNNKSSEVSLILCAFSRIIVFSHRFWGLISVSDMGSVLWNDFYIQSESGWLLPYHLCHCCASGQILPVVVAHRIPSWARLVIIFFFQLHVYHLPALWNLASRDEALSCS